VDRCTRRTACAPIEQRHRSDHGRREQIPSDALARVLGGRGDPGVAHAYERALPFLRAFNVLNHAPRSIAERAQRRDRRRLAWYRVRLGGGFDLKIA
jgi:hypothetical protein